VPRHRRYPAEPESAEGRSTAQSRTTVRVWRPLRGCLSRGVMMGHPQPARPLRGGAWHGGRCICNGNSRERTWEAHTEVKGR